MVSAKKVLYASLSPSVRSDQEAFSEISISRAREVLEIASQQMLRKGLTSIDLKEIGEFDYPYLRFVRPYAEENGYELEGFTLKVKESIT